MGNNFKNLLSQYLSELQSQYEESVRTGEMTPELSYRPLLDKFFGLITSGVNSQISRVFEPKTQSGSGRPDWRFYNSENLGIYGYVEAKGLDINRSISVSDHQDQIDMYRSLGHKILLTDGLDFIFIYPDISHPKLISLVNKPITKSWFLSDNALLLGNEFNHFFKKLGARAVTEQQLITECALRAKALSKNISALVNAPLNSGLDEQENRTIAYLKDLKKIIENHHDPLLNENSSFAGFVSQVLIFGLIYAHRVVADPKNTPLETYSKIKGFWSDSINKNYTENLRPFSALVLTLENELSKLGPLGTWYEDCCLLLAHVKLTEKQSKLPDYHSLFETFLSVFDPQTRFDFGAFFTPHHLAKYTVLLSEQVAKSEFEDVNLYDKNNKLIDPCCGTGSFLEELFKSALAVSKTPSIIGFEILPGPYALAHYRMSMISDKYPQNLKIILTNTLSDDIEKKSEKAGNNIDLISEEQEAARNLATPPLTLIIGNPPSSDSQNRSTGDDFKLIQGMLDDFRPPVDQRTSRQNTQKQLQNEFVKFLRWSVNKILLSKNGILAMIIPSSFAESNSYKFARKFLVENFSRVWVLDIDSDARTGIRSTSLFNTLQGRLLFVAVKSNKSKKASKLYYQSINEMSVSEKVKFLQSDGNLLRNFAEINLEESSYSLRPRKKFNNKIYERFWDLYSDLETGRYIFKRHCSGIKLAPSSMFVHVSKPLLERRSLEIANSEISAQEIIKKWYVGQDRPPSTSKFSDAVRKEIKEVLNSSSEPITDYAFRPFLTIPAFISEKVLQRLSQVGGGGTRYRPEILAAFAEKETLGIAIAPSTKDLGERLHRFASFCWSLPDNDLCKRGNAHVFCNTFPEYKRANNSWNSKPQNNVNPAILKRLKIGKSEDLLFYVYALLCSDSYLDEFEGALFTQSSSESWPKIPITSDPLIFNKISNFGKKLAELERPVKSSDIRLEKPFKDFESLYSNEFSLDDFVINEGDESILLKSSNNYLLELKPIPVELLEFQASGYQVLQQWLKMYSYRYSRSSFTKEHFRRLLYLLQSISEQIKITNSLDQLISPMIHSGKSLF